MKLSKTILSGFLFSFFFFENGFSQCDNSAIEYINANQIKAAVLNGGDLFWNRNDGQFIVPYTPGPFEEVSTIFAQGLWLGGFDVAGNLRVAGQMYGSSSGQADYWAGPIDDATGATLPNGCRDFDRIWKITRGDILWVKEDFADNGMIDQPLPFSIQTWPARGNEHFATAMGFQLPDQELAPFFDNNNNGLYEPMNGDHPVIDPARPDAIPDEMAWCVFNDIEGLHGETNSSALGVEVHLMMYAFNCSENEVLNHTIFTSHKIINKSQENLSNFKMGFFIDTDLGCYVDDGFGCDTVLNTQYSYNVDNVDGDPLCNGISVYGEGVPVQAATFLNHSLGNFMYFGNPSVPGAPIPTNGPAFYNTMNSIWADGSHLTYGGDGYDPNGLPVDHAFFDHPNDPSGWSMLTESPPLSNKRIVLAMEAFDFPVGGQTMLDVAYSFHRQPGADNLENVDVALAAIPDIQSFYDNGFSSACTQFQFCNTDCVWPGDAGNDGIAKNDDLLYIGVSMGKNAMGPERDPAMHVWSPYIANNWGLLPNNDVDQKHQDCNGDGSVNELDWYILEKNYGAKRPDYEPTELEAPFSLNQLYIEIQNDQISTTATQLQRRLKGFIHFASQDEPFPEIYGLAFTIKFDTSVWTTLFPNILDLQEDNFLGQEEDLMMMEKYFPEEGRMEGVISRKDGQPVVDVFGQLGRIHLFLREDARTGNFNGEDTVSLQLVDAVGVDANGHFFTLGGRSETVILTDMVYDSTLNVVEDSLLSDAPDFLISPNPSNGLFELNFENTALVSQISVYNFSGKEVLTVTIPAGTSGYTIDLAGQLQTGIYFIKWTLPDGQFTMRKVVVK